jgi:hypothetical protein
MGVTWATPPNRPANEVQLRRRNDGVECKAFRRFGRRACPEMPHNLGFRRVPKYPTFKRNSFEEGFLTKGHFTVEPAGENLKPPWAGALVGAGIEFNSSAIAASIGNQAERAQKQGQEQAMHGPLSRGPNPSDTVDRICESGANTLWRLRKRMLVKIDAGVRPSE